MRIVVKALTGRELFIETISLSHTTEVLKEKIAALEGFPPDKQHLSIHGKQLENGRTLQYYDVKDGSVIRIVLRGDRDCMRNHVQSIKIGGYDYVPSQKDPRKYPVNSAISVTLDDSPLMKAPVMSLLDVKSNEIVRGTFYYNQTTRNAVFMPTRHLKSYSLYVCNMDIPDTDKVSTFRNHSIRFETTATVDAVATVAAANDVIAATAAATSTAAAGSATGSATTGGGDAPTAKCTTAGIPAVLSRLHTRQTVLCSEICTTGVGCLASAVTTCNQRLHLTSHDRTQLYMMQPCGKFVPLRHDADMMKLRPNDILYVRSIQDPELPTSVANQSVTTVRSLETYTTVIQRKDFHLENVLSMGSFSTVYRGLWRKTPCAVKLLRSTMTGQQRETLQREIDALVSLRHPRIVTLLAVCTSGLSPSEGYAALLLEYLERGNLFEALHPTVTEGGRETAVVRWPVSLLDQLKIAVDIADGMRFLHSSSIAHRDLKSANVLINNDGRAKLTDFGLSGFYRACATHMTSVVGTPAWTAPEVLAEDHFRNSADVYSFGVVLWELLTGQVPWAGKSAVQIITAVCVQRQCLAAPQASRDCPEALLAIMNACLDMKESNRPSFDDLSKQFQALAMEESRRVQSAAIAVPNCFLCPISLEIMQYPVILCDGHTYERRAITEWLSRSNSSPLTNKPLSSRELIPNYALGGAIEGFLKEQPQRR